MSRQQPPASTLLTLDVAAGTPVEPLRAHWYRHPVLGERPVVRLVGETAAPGEDAALAFLGFAPAEASEPLARAPRRALGFPSWVLVNDPARAGQALAVVKDMERAAHLARTKPGHAKDRYEALARRLPPAHLPSFWEQAGRAFLSTDRRRCAPCQVARQHSRRPAAPPLSGGSIRSLPRARPGTRPRRPAPMDAAAGTSARPRPSSRSRSRDRGRAPPRRAAGLAVHALGLGRVLAGQPSATAPHGQGLRRGARRAAHPAARAGAAGVGAVARRGRLARSFPRAPAAPVVAPPTTACAALRADRAYGPAPAGRRPPPDPHPETVGPHVRCESDRCHRRARHSCLRPPTACQDRPARVAAERLRRRGAPFTGAHGGRPAIPAAAERRGSELLRLCRAVGR